jgi:hypothetical protein
MVLLEWLYYDENDYGEHAEYRGFIEPAIPNM